VKKTLKVAIPALVLMMGSAMTFGGEEKVTICHYPPGNAENWRLLSVGVSAVPAHFANHGDNYPGQGGNNSNSGISECPDCGSGVCPGPSK
jgi:hypothetical protein